MAITEPWDKDKCSFRASIYSDSYTTGVKVHGSIHVLELYYELKASGGCFQTKHSIIESAVLQQCLQFLLLNTLMIF